MSAEMMIRWLGGTLPTVFFLLTILALLESKYPKKATRWALIGFLGAELAVQGFVLALGDSPELVFTLLPLTCCLPAILGVHVLSGRPFVPTAVSWLMALLCQHLLLVVQKLLAMPKDTLDWPAWPWISLGLLLLAAVGLLAAVLRGFRPPFRAAAEEMGGSWWPLLPLLVMLLALHSYFLSSTTTAIVLLLLLFTALADFWALVRLMTSMAAETQARQSRIKMEALQQDYALLQKKLELGRSYRHDARHHMLALSTLLQQGETDAALDYVSDWQGQVARIETRNWCKNAVVNAVLSAYVAQAEEAGCTVEAEVSLPGELPVEELDLCVALANAMENAIHACQSVPEGRRWIKLELAMAQSNGQRITLHVENACGESVEIGEDGFPVTKPREGHGQGLRSIAAVGEKYHGMFQCEYTEGAFGLWLVMLDAAAQPKRTRRAPAVCAGVFLALFLLNCMPALAQTLEAIPVLGHVVRVVDLRSYSWLWGDSGVSVETPVLDGDDQAVDQVEAQKEEFIAQMKDVFIHYAARKYHGYVGEDVSYEVMRDDEELFILRFDATINVGGSVDYHRHVVLDKGSGQVLELADLFLDDVNYVFPISREIKAQMAERVNAGEGDYFIPGGIWSEEECFQSIDPEGQDFYINKAGQLVIAFGEYEVAPGYVGSPEFTIPTDLLDGLLTQPSLLEREG